MFDYARHARKNGCRLRLMTGDATDAAGNRIGPDACARCVGCDRARGDMGLANETGMRLRGEDGGVQLVWQCPECNREVVEDTDWLSVNEDARRCAGDPLCYHCRAVRPNAELTGADRRPG